MIFHMLCLFLMMMMVNFVISAPGQMDEANDMSQARKDKPKYKSSGTLDPLGGGHLLKVDNPDVGEHNFRSLELLVSYQDEIPQNMALVSREDKGKTSSSGTLDPLGGGNFVRIVDPDIETEFSRSLKSLLENQDIIPLNIISLAGEDKQKSSSSGTLDSIGGGNLVRVVDPAVDAMSSRFSNSFLDSQDNDLQNAILLDREEKQKPSSSGTLDPIGGGNIVRVVDPGVNAIIFRSFHSLLDNQDNTHQNTDLLFREEKPKPSCSGTLDPIGGGNLIRIVDPGVDAIFFRSSYSLLDNQDNVLQNMALLVREENQKPTSSGTVDSLGGDNFVRVVDEMLLRSSPSLLDIQDNILQNSALLARKEKQKSSSSGTLDPLGGGNLVKIDDSEANVLRSMESLIENQDNIRQNMALLAREEKQKPSSSGTIDPLGGGNLVKIDDSEANVLRPMESLIENQDNIRQNMALFAREEKQKPSSSGTLDPLGGGNLVRIDDSEANVLKSMESLTENQENIRQNMALLSREEKQKPSSSGVLDPLGGGNFVKIDDSEANVLRSMESLIENQNREENRTSKPDSSPSGTLDPIGGNSIVRTDEEAFRTLESHSDNQGRQNMMRLAREDKSTQRSSHALDGLGGSHIADPYRGQIFRSLDRNHFVDSVDQGGDVLRMLDSISGTDLLSSLDSAEGMAVLSALRKTHTKYPKRMLDSVSGWAFGESKRNFDEIDNVGFTGFAKRSPRYRQLALAKKNFDEIDRAGFETYNKRDFDEIDRTGFETFDKRDRKE